MQALLAALLLVIITIHEINVIAAESTIPSVTTAPTTVPTPPPKTPPTTTRTPSTPPPTTPPTTTTTTPPPTTTTPPTTPSTTQTLSTTTSTKTSKSPTTVQPSSTTTSPKTTPSTKTSSTTSPSSTITSTKTSKSQTTKSLQTPTLLPTATTPKPPPTTTTSSKPQATISPTTSQTTTPQKTSSTTSESPRSSNASDSPLTSSKSPSNRTTADHVKTKNETGLTPTFGSTVKNARTLPTGSAKKSSSHISSAGTTLNQRATTQKADTNQESSAPNGPAIVTARSTTKLKSASSFTVTRSSIVTGSTNKINSTGSTSQTTATEPTIITTRKPKYETYAAVNGTICRRGFRLKDEMCVYLCEDIVCQNDGVCTLVNDMAGNKPVAMCRCKTDDEIEYSGDSCEISKPSRLKERKITLGILIPLICIITLILSCTCLKLKRNGKAARALRNHYDLNSGAL